MEETHQELKYRPDPGLEAGKWIMRQFQNQPKYVKIVDKAAEIDMDDARSLLDDELPPGYRTTEGSPQMPSSPTLLPVKYDIPRQSRGIQKAFTKQVVLNIVGYGLLA